MRVAIQGQAGSFHDQVAKQWYGETVRVVPCTSFSEVFEAYQQGLAEAIVVAVENTIYGSINEVYGLIEDCNLPIVGEVKQSIHQMLITNPSTKLDDITEVYSHPVALAQCRNYLKHHLPQAEPIEYFDTAGAVEFIKADGRSNTAAIAGEQAAKLHRLSILAENIEDSADNITRFLILEPAQQPPAAANRASLVVTAAHKPGALSEVLQVFASSNINLVKLQSQPIIGQPWNYKFFIDVDAAGVRLHQAVQTIKADQHQVVILGEYPAAS